MSKKQFEWDSCPKCGQSPIEIETESQEYGKFHDGDIVTCPKCAQQGNFSCDGDGGITGYIDWWE